MKKTLWILIGLLAVTIPAQAQTWNPFAMTARSDNTMTIRGVVLSFEDNVPVGGCSMVLHHSESLSDVQVVLDATRGRDCEDVRKRVALATDPLTDRVIVKAKGRLTTEDDGNGIGQDARLAVLAALEGVDCTATKGASPQLALGPLQRVREEVAKAEKRIGQDGPRALAQVRVVLVQAQDDLEQAAHLTVAGPVCVVEGVAELRKLVEALPVATRQTLHATGVQIARR